MRGLTSAGQEGRGLRIKGKKSNKVRPSRRANWKRRNLLRLKRYRWLNFLLLAFQTSNKLIKIKIILGYLHSLLYNKIKNVMILKLENGIFY